MKRKELEQKLRIAGCYLKREGKSHSLWINPKNGIIEAVPRQHGKNVYFSPRVTQPFLPVEN